MPTVHSLARAGILRRKLSISNPINYFQLAEVIASNQQTILGHVTQSNIFPYYAASSHWRPTGDNWSQKSVVSTYRTVPLSSIISLLIADRH